ncbi:MAG TPA: hypothetical protein VJL59_01145 [Anaerolineales bacterium]|nr:hypothetical protein [Anaerolineales bacterium]
MRRLLPLLAAFVLLGLAYSAVVPLFETPDELQHYAVVQYIARYWWFPPLGQQPGEHLWDQETLQAPLYHWLSAAATFWIDTSDFSRQAILQPKANIGDATLPGKKNAFLHGPAQAFPYHATTLAVHIARWLSLLFGVGTILLTFYASRFVLTPQPSVRGDPIGASDTWLSLLPAAFLAFIPQFIFMHAAVSNDTAMTFTSTASLATLLWIARDGMTTRRAALLGLAIGLMSLSKLMGTVLAVLAIVLVVILTRRLKPTAVVAGVWLAVAGWWYLRNQIVYGDPVALTAFLTFMSGNFTIPATSFQFVWDQFRLLRFSTWGLFGHISVLMQPEWIYFVYDAFAVIGAAGFVLGAGRELSKGLRRRNDERSDDFSRSTNKATQAALFEALKTNVVENRALLIVLVWLATVLAVGARWFLAAGIQGRLVFPGLPAGAVLLAYGLRTLFNRVSPRTLTLAVSLPMAAFAAAVVPLYLIPAYSSPPLVDRVAADATQTGIRFGDEIALRGYTIAREGDLLRFTFYWEALKTPPVDYTVAVRLVRPDGTLWLDYVNYPGMGTTLPTTWTPGQLRRDEYIFDVDRFPAEAAPLRLIVGFYDARVRDMIPVSNWNDVREKGWATLTEVRLTNGK